MFKQLFERRDVPAATTISGLIDVAAQWLDGGASDRTLQTSLETVQARVTEGYDRTRLDLAQTDLAPGLLQPAQRAVEALGQVLSAIAEMRQGGVQEGLQRLRAAAEAFAHANAEVDAWKRSQIPSCPRCGRRQSGSEMFCDACQIHLVIPDNSGTQFPSVTVGPLHLAVYRACHSVADGGISIDEFLETLPPLEARIYEMVHLAGASQEHVGEAEAAVASRDLHAITEQAQLTQEGIDRLRRFALTHAIADINTGWAWIARAAINLQQLIPSLQQVTDRMAGESVSPQLEVHDSVLIGAED